MPMAKRIGRQWIVLLFYLSTSNNILTLQSCNSHISTLKLSVLHYPTRICRKKNSRQPQVQCFRCVYSLSPISQEEFGQICQDTIPSYPDPWLPNTLQKIGMCRFPYPWQTTVASTPFLAFSQPGEVNKNSFTNFAFKALNLKDQGYVLCTLVTLISEKMNSDKFS